MDCTDHFLSLINHPKHSHAHSHNGTAIRGRFQYLAHRHRPGIKPLTPWLVDDPLYLLLYSTYHILIYRITYEETDQKSIQTFLCTQWKCTSTQPEMQPLYLYTSIILMWSAWPLFSLNASICIIAFSCLLMYSMCTRLYLSAYQGMCI